MFTKELLTKTLIGFSNEQKVAIITLLGVIGAALITQAGLVIKTMLDTKAAKEAAQSIRTENYEQHSTTATSVNALTEAINTMHGQIELNGDVATFNRDQLKHLGRRLDDYINDHTDYHAKLPEVLMQIVRDELERHKKEEMNGAQSTRDGEDREHDDGGDSYVCERDHPDAPCLPGMQVDGMENRD